MNSVSPRIATPRLLRSAADARIGRDGVAVQPEHAAGLRVDRQHVVRPLRHVHDAVDDERRGLPGAEHLVRQDPLQLEVLDVRRVDLRQRLWRWLE